MTDMFIICDLRFSIFTFLRLSLSLFLLPIAYWLLSIAFLPPSPVFLPSFISPPQADSCHSSKNPGAYIFTFLRLSLRLSLFLLSIAYCLLLIVYCQGTVRQPLPPI